MRIVVASFKPVEQLKQQGKKKQTAFAIVSSVLVLKIFTDSGFENLKTMVQKNLHLFALSFGTTGGSKRNEHDNLIQGQL